MTADELERLLETFIQDGLAMSKHLQAKDIDDKPVVTLKEMTEFGKLAVDFWDRKRGPREEGYGTALGGKRG